MREADGQLQRIRASQQGATPPSTFAVAAVSTAPPLDGGPAAFVLESNAPLPLQELKIRLSRLFDGISFRIEPLFFEDWPRFFRLVFDSACFGDLGGSPFELGYFLEDRLALKSAEPDLVTDFHPWVTPDVSGDRAEASAAGFACFDDADGGPLNDAWAINTVGAQLVWAKTRGEGVVIAHIDTGVAGHVELDGANIDWPGIDIIDPGTAAEDPLDQGLFLQPGHGTATASVIISKGNVTGQTTRPPGLITGVAPEARLLPIRAIRSVIRLNQSNVARAIDAAVQRDVHVITMSLGGLPMRALQQAIERAVCKNIIVVAAAGNCVGSVVFPAAYRDCIAVGAVDPSLVPWRGSSSGSAVAFCAPGAHVPHAMRQSNDQPSDAVKRGQGTSFAVALAAGVAALWLSSVGRSAAIAALKPGETLQERFRRVITTHARKPPGWNSEKYGAGILDAKGTVDAGVGVPSPRPDSPGVSASIAALLNDRDRTQQFSPDVIPERFAPEIAWLIFNQGRVGPALSPTPSAMREKSSALEALIARRPDLQAVL